MQWLTRASLKSYSAVWGRPYAGPRPVKLGIMSLPMPFQITATRHFSAAHQLRLYDGSLEPLHGHNWVVRVTVGRSAGRAGLDAIGVVMDFHVLERFIDEVVRPMDNRNLNDVPPFGEGQLNPTTENVALHVGRSVQPKLPDGVVLLSVEVWETATCRAVYRP